MSRVIPFLLLALLWGAGCSCPGSSVTPDAGGKPPGTQEDAGGGGGADGGEQTDAGDGSSTVGIAPGGFVLDGGTGGEPTGTGDGVMVDPDGNLVLNSAEVQLHFAWIANNAAGTVSKFDTKTAREVGRYHTVVPRDGLGNTLGTLAGNAANNPSRTAVDLYGDVWVANRAEGNGVMGSVTKIANTEEACVDRNGDGVIQTSRDLNNDGVISPNPADGEMIFPSNWADPTQYDECILFSTEVGGTTGGVKARALAISLGVEGSAGAVWVGVWNQKAVVRLDPVNGQIVPVNGQPGGPLSITFPNFTSGPYGAAVDGLQRLWVVDALQSRLGLVDTTTGTLVNDNIFFNAQTASYGVTVDGKNRVWLAGWLGPYVSRYDHSDGSWMRFDFDNLQSPSGTGFGRGRGVAVDEGGTVYMSATTNAAGQGAAQLIAFDAETGAVRPFNTPTGPAQFIDATDGTTHTSIGVGLDSDGNVWVNNHSGNAMRVHPTTGELLKTPNQPGNLYTYSDFTGYALRKFTAPRGSYQQVFQGCGPSTKWRTLTWDAAVPQGTAVQAYVKVGDTQAALDNPQTTRYGPFTSPPVDLVAEGVPRGNFMRVELVLISNDGETSPVLKSFDVNWICEIG